MSDYDRNTPREVRRGIISIIIPTYNRAQLVVRTLDSVLNQTSDCWECWVIDDFSNDNTRDVVQTYCERDSRFHYALNESKKGAQGARNTGIKLCTGDWVLLLDSDNEITRDYVNQVLCYICDYPQVDVVTNFIQVIGPDFQNDEIKKWITEGNILVQLLNEKTYVDNSSACIRKEKLFSIGLLDEDCPSYQEWDTHLRLAQGCVYGCIQKPLTLYYNHDGGRISKNTGNVYGYGLYVLKKHKALWFSKVGETQYLHLLIHVYNQHEQDPLSMKLRVLWILFTLSPKLCKQLLKRRYRTWKK